MTFPGRPLTDILASTAIDMPEGKATSFLGATLTFLELKRRSDALAAALVDLGIRQGDRVGIMLPNCPQYVITTFAILRIGAIVVNINPSYTAREVLTVATDSGIRVLVTLDALAPLVQGIRDQTGIEQIAVTSLAEHSVAAAAPPRVDGALTLADLIATDAGPACRSSRSRPAIWRSCSTRAARPARRRARC